MADWWDPKNKGESICDWIWEIKHCLPYQQTMALVTTFSSVQFSHSVVSPQWLQHARPICSPATPGVYSNSHPSSRWCHPTISSSIIPFSSCFQSFPVSGSFPMNQLSTLGGQSIFSFNISPSNEYSGLISFRIYWLDFLAV